MVSVPVDLDDRGVESVLSAFGPVDTRRWRLLRWIPGLGSYAEYPNMDGAFDPCEAYWLISFNGDDFEVGNGESVDPLEPCFVTVQPGWNQFGSPYAFPVAWNDVVFDGFLDGPVLYDAAAGGQDPYVYDVEVLEPWQGYWVFNPGTQNVFLSFRPVEATGKAGKSARDRHLAGDEFELRLKAVLPEYGLADTRNHVGLSADATDAFDELDFAEAPPIGDHVRLSILEDDLRLAGSFRPDDGRGQVWDLRISAERNGAPVNGIVRVAVDEFGARPDGFGLQVVDPDAGLPVRLGDDGFEIELTSSRPVRNLRLIVGSAAFLSEAAEAISEVPLTAKIDQNYPNPFRTSTRIGYQVDTGGRTELVVFDPVGRRVRTLVDAHREPGRYETEWNGRDDTGGYASSGLYFYVLRTADGADSGTMVLLR
ncbi:MAG: hypothetical protein HKN17_06805 [Rhodothermales bacterium]|nr:hypothetical protein [Rhodothermales bacterium]